MIFTSEEIKAFFGYSPKTAITDAPAARKYFRNIRRNQWVVKKKMEEDSYV